MLSSTNCRRCSMSAYWIGVLVKREATSKLMTMSSDVTRRLCIFCRKATDLPTSCTHTHTHTHTQFFHTSCRKTCGIEALAKQSSQWRQTVKLIWIPLLLPMNIVTPHKKILYYGPRVYLYSKNDSTLKCSKEIGAFYIYINWPKPKLFERKSNQPFALPFSAHLFTLNLSHSSFRLNYWKL